MQYSRLLPKLSTEPNVLYKLYFLFGLGHQGLVKIESLARGNNQDLSTLIIMSCFVPCFVDCDNCDEIEGDNGLAEIFVQTM